MHSTYHAWEELCVWLELSHSSTQRAWGRERERGSEAAHYGLSSFPLMAGEEETVGGGSKGGATNREVAAPACREGGGPSVLRRADRSSLLCSARMLQPPPPLFLSLSAHTFILSPLFSSLPLSGTVCSFLSLPLSLFFPPPFFSLPWRVAMFSAPFQPFCERAESEWWKGRQIDRGRDPVRVTETQMHVFLNLTSAELHFQSALDKLFQR